MKRMTVADRAVEVRQWITTGAARQMRLGADLSLADVAQSCEVTPVAVLRWERGERRPRGRNIVAYHQFLSRLADRAKS